MINYFSESKFYSLDDLRRLDLKFLIDCSVFQIFLGASKFSQKGDFLSLAKDSKQVSDSISFWMENLDKFNYFITERVSKELYYDNYPVHTQENFRGKKINTSKTKKKFFKALTKEMNRKNSLVYRLRESERVISFEGEERKKYEEIYEKNKNLRELYNLTERGYELLSSGITLFLGGNSLGIISNDFSLLKAWKSWIISNNVSLDVFPFFNRVDFNQFRQGV